MKSRQQEWSEQMVREGRCRVCGQPREDNKHYCPKHAKENSCKSLSRQNTLIEAGRCACCGKERGEKGTKRLCRPCADRHIESVQRCLERRRLEHSDKPTNHP